MISVVKLKEPNKTKQNKTFLWLRINLDRAPEFYDQFRKYSLRHHLNANLLGA